MRIMWNLLIMEIMSLKRLTAKYQTIVIKKFVEDKDIQEGRVLGK